MGRVHQDGDQQPEAGGASPSSPPRLPQQVLQQEIEELQVCLTELRLERSQQSTLITPPSGANPREIMQACRDRARLTVEQSAELKGIDDAIVTLEQRLISKQAELLAYGNLRQLRQQQAQLEIEQGRLAARQHADRINEIAVELAHEVRALRTIADQLSPLFWELEGRPFITGFKRVTVPHVRSDSRVWTVVNRVI